MKLKEIYYTINAPEKIEYGVRLGENKGNSTITEIFINTESSEEIINSMRFFGISERKDLVKILKKLAKDIENEL